MSCPPWYAPSNFRTLSRFVKLRAMRSACMVDSEPEFVKRICSREKRSQISSAARTSRSWGMPYSVPSSAALARARAITGFAWPTIIAPKQSEKSTYSRPSMSHMREPEARSM